MWLGFIFCLLWIIGVRLITKLGIEKDNKIDLSLNSASEYTLSIGNLPFGEFTEQDIIDFLNEISADENQQLQILSLQVIYNVANCRNLIHEIHDLALYISLMLYKEEEHQFEKIRNRRDKEYKEKKKLFILKLMALRKVR